MSKWLYERSSARNVSKPTTESVSKWPGCGSAAGAADWAGDLASLVSHVADGSVGGFCGGGSRGESSLLKLNLWKKTMKNGSH